MEAGGGELAEIQAELAQVKRALRDGTVHLGMGGETLQRYLLQLNEKENLMLSRQLRHMAADSLEPLLGSPPIHAGARGAAVPSAADRLSGSPDFGPQEEPAAAIPPPAAPQVPRVEPRQAPEGPPKAFDKESLPSVLNHMSEYEAVPLESGRALRALSSLAYADAARVNEGDAALRQLLRLLAIHTGEAGVQLGAMRALCNMAYDRVAAARALSEPAVMAALLASASLGPEPKEAAVKASEAIARIVAAEVNPEDGQEAAGGENAARPALPPPNALGALASLFLAAASGEASWQVAVPRLVSQLVANEVVELQLVADRFVRAGQRCTPDAALGWLSLARFLSAPEDHELPPVLVEAGAISTASQVMQRFSADGAVQLAGIEAMSSLVGNRWAGLQAFADVGGMERIEDAMRTHARDIVLQTKGVRALASGAQWPVDVQQRAVYSHRRAVELTKAAMAQHGDCVELQSAGLEALAKYLEKLRCVEEVKALGGEGLVKAMMARHTNVQKVQHWGRSVLEGLGVEKSWAPKGVAAGAPGAAQS